MVDFTVAAQPNVERIVEAIRQGTAPELVLLFGSRARGEARPDSDYDLMLVFRDGADIEGDRRAASEAVRAIGVSADLLACSVSDYLRRQHDPGFLEWLVSREGVLLYGSGAVPQHSPRPARVREEPREGLQMWIERAEADFREAELSLGSSRPVRDAICFHSHACVEKLLKALIVKRGTHPPHTHELPHLLVMQRSALRDDAELIAACALLQDLYPKSRYPEMPMPTSDEARRAFEAAKQVRDRLLPSLTR